MKLMQTRRAVNKAHFSCLEDYILLLILQLKGMANLLFAFVAFLELIRAIWLFSHHQVLLSNDLVLMTFITDPGIFGDSIQVNTFYVESILATIAKHHLGLVVLLETYLATLLLVD